MKSLREKLEDFGEEISPSVRDLLWSYGFQLEERLDECEIDEALETAFNLVADLRDYAIHAEDSILVREGTKKISPDLAKIEELIAEVRKRLIEGIKRCEF